MSKSGPMRFGISLLGSILLCALVASRSYAVTVTITGDDLFNAANGVPSDSSKIEKYVAAQFVQEIRKAGVVIAQGGLMLSGTLPEQRDDFGTCGYKRAYNQRYQFWVDRNVEFKLDFQSLNSTSTVSIELPAHGEITGSYLHKEQVFRMGGWCENKTIVDGTFTGKVGAVLSFKLDVTLNPQLTKVNGIPQINFSNSVVNLEATARKTSASVHVVGHNILTAYLGTIVNFINLKFTATGELNFIANSKLNRAISPAIANAEAVISNKLKQTAIELPRNSDKVVAGLTAVFQLPYLANYIKLNADDLLYYAVIGDQQKIQSIVGSAAACEATHALRSRMTHQTLYTSAAGSCVVADLDGTNTGSYFADAACSKRVNYRPTPYTSFCSQALTVPSKLGVEKLAPETSPTWTLANGPRFDLGVDSIATNAAPFMARTTYQNVGFCNLEMRIYKKEINATNLKPLLALHGGSWKYRGFGYVGLESQISHFTEAGFLVFMPSYRLTGADAGNASCGYAGWQQITSDATYAADWIKLNGAFYGASNDKIAVFGQSAGAHLATYVALNRPNDVDRGLLLYPPTDAGDFMRNLQSGAIVNPLGVESLQAFLGVDLRNPASLSSPAVNANSFPALVAPAPAAYPPVYIIHGRSDTLVPSSQSVRLCNAYAGAADPSFGPALNDGGLIEKAYQCGPSQLHLVAQGEHTLDFCIPGVLCPAGDSASQTAVRDSLRHGRNWLKSNSLNLIQNPSFEVGTGSWPSVWVRDQVAGSTAIFAWDGVAKRSGARSVSITNPTGGASISYPAVAYDATKTYLATAWIKTQGVSIPAARLEFNFYDANWKWLGYLSSTALDGTADWRKVALSAAPGSVPAGTVNIDVAVVMDSAVGTAWFDDVSFGPALGLYSTLIQ